MPRRLPIYILLDRSTAMAGPARDAAFSLLNLLLDDLHANPMTAETAWLSFLTFADQARQETPLTALPLVTLPHLPHLPSEGAASLPPAFRLLNACIARDLPAPYPPSNTHPDWEPSILVLLARLHPAPSQPPPPSIPHRRYRRLVVVACDPDASTTSIVPLSPLPDECLPISLAQERGLAGLFPDLIEYSRPVPPDQQLLRAALAHGETIEFLGHSSLQLTDGTLFDTVDDGLKVVFRSRPPHGHVDESTWMIQRAIVGRYNVTASGPHAAFWQSHYQWPRTLLSEIQPHLPESFFLRHRLLLPVQGYVLPVLPDLFRMRTLQGKVALKQATFFASAQTRQRLVPPEEQGTLRSTLVACAKLARAIRHLHHHGLAHGHLHPGAVLFSPRHGEAMLLEILDIIAPPRLKSDSLPMPGYAAPEILTASRPPGFSPAAADLHALAVILYRLLFHRHPLIDGQRLLSQSPEDHDLLSLGPNALFIEDPKDTSNAFASPPRIPLARLGPHLEHLFLRTFVDGLHHPGARASAIAWENALYHTLDLLHPSPDGRDFAVICPGQPRRFLATDAPLSWTIPVGTYLLRHPSGHLVPSEHTVVLHDGATLHPWHAFSGLAPDERMPRPFPRLAQILFDRTDNRFKLRNDGEQPMFAQTGTQPRVSLLPGASLTLRPGLVLQLGAHPTAALQSPRLLRIDFLQPDPHS